MTPNIELMSPACFCSGYRGGNRVHLLPASTSWRPLKVRTVLCQAGFELQDRKATFTGAPTAINDGITEATDRLGLTVLRRF